MSLVVLEQLFQTIEAEGRTGLLEVDGNTLRGRVSFAEGAPCQAETDEGNAGKDAIRRLLEAAPQGGHYRVRETELTPEVEVDSSFSNILLEQFLGNA